MPSRRTERRSGSPRSTQPPGRRAQPGSARVSCANTVPETPAFTTSRGGTNAVAFGIGGDGQHGPDEYADTTTIEPYYQALTDRSGRFDGAVS